MNSLYLKLNSRDFQRGAVVAALGALVGALNAALQAGSFDPFAFDWLGIAKLAGGALLSYLLKNLLSDETGKFLGKV